MKLTTEAHEKRQEIVEIIWEIAGGGAIFVLCFFFWMLAVAYE